MNGNRDQGVAGSGTSRTASTAAASAAMLLALSGCLATAPQAGGGDKGAVSGGAGGATSANASSTLEKCEQSLGTLGVVEEQGAPWYASLRSHNLGSTVPVIRLMIQQSNCFVIVERGAAMANMRPERVLEQAGEARAGSNFGKGQMVAADYTMSPSIQSASRPAAPRPDWPASRAASAPWAHWPAA